MPLPPGSDRPKSIADRIEAIDHALTTKELAHMLRVSGSSLYARAREGRMGRAVIRFGGTIRFDPVYTAQWLRSME
jgi:iron only hydrogenase large subunit-like protein